MKSNGPPGMLCEFVKLLLIKLLVVRPRIYLRELQQELSDCTCNLVDISTVCRAVRKMGMTRQKNSTFCLATVGTQVSRVYCRDGSIRFFHHRMDRRNWM